MLNDETVENADVAGDNENSTVVAYAKDSLVKSIQKDGAKK